MASPPGLRPEEAFHRENLLRVLIPNCQDGHNSLCFQASGSDSFAGLPAPLKTTTSFRTQSATTLPSLVSIFILRCDRDGHVRLLSCFYPARVTLVNTVLLIHPHRSDRF